MATISTLLHTLPQRGSVEWIGLRPGRREPMVRVDRVLVSPAFGLEGDRYAGRTGDRHVTLVQAEHLAAIASFLYIATVKPEELRRNVVVRDVI